MKKRLLSLLLALALLLALFPAFTPSADAATLSDVAAFVKKWDGKKISGAYGSECVALFDEYIQSLFGVNWRNYGVYGAQELYDKDYSSLGWTKHAAGTYNYQVGDIVVWKAWGTRDGKKNTVGHVAIVSSVSGSVEIFEQGKTMNCRKHGLYYTDAIRGIIRPKFSDTATGTEMASGYDRAIPDGDYLIVSFKDPQYQLDIIGNDVPAGDGTNVNLWPLDGGTREQDVFTLRYNETDKFYSIMQKGTNMSLDVSGASKQSGANVQMWSANGGAAQKWAITDAWDGDHWIGYRIQAKCSAT